MKSELKLLYMRMLHYKEIPISQIITDKGAIIIKFAVKRIGYEKMYGIPMPRVRDLVVLDPPGVLTKIDDNKPISYQVVSVDES